MEQADPVTAGRGETHFKDLLDGWTKQQIDLSARERVATGACKSCKDIAFLQEVRRRYYLSEVFKNLLALDKVDRMMMHR
jgi:hypothetical protein